MAEDVKHDYHLVNPSPWPLLGAVAVTTLAIGGVTYMKGLFGIEHGQLWALAPGFLMVIWVMIGWWREVIKEGRTGDHTPVVEIGLKYGMVLFIVSEIMFFAAWFWSFFEFAIFFPARVGDTFDHLSPVWEGLNNFKEFPPVGVETFDPFHLPLMNTLILLLSGTTVTAAHHSLQHGKYDNAKLMLWITVILGLAFTGLQVLEYSEAQFTFDGTIYGSAFFMATGFHGAHVVIGTIFLAICLMRLYANNMTAEKHLGFEFAAWYWHFVDVVWLFLFAFVYVLPHLALGH
ncbi:MAG: cytochrome c oxidase subunit 3 [Henriciella sp.]|jgi:cytochrome c oxidase subunit 3